MIRYVGCDFAQARLDAFVDGELAMGDQVLVESHLRWCDTCAARLEDVQTIGASLRVGARGSADDGLGRALATMQAEVLARVDTEYEQSLTVRVQELFSDMRLWWPALGATVAVVLSVGLASGVWRATSDDQPASLAAMIENLADPGSNRNPLRLDNAMYLPRVLDDPDSLDGAMLAQYAADSHADDVVAVATVVTREGTIGGYTLLDDLGSAGAASLGLSKTAARDREGLLHAVRQSRFAPAQRPGVGVVAVNMVWLFARTTVKASHETVDLGRPLTRPTIAMSPPAVTKPAVVPAEGASSRDLSHEPPDAPMESATA